jgi:hypothetical protein
MQRTNDPGYWINDTSGVLTAVVTRYLRGKTLNAVECGVMRDYFAQWIRRGLFRGEEVEQLRRDVHTLRNHDDIADWIRRATDAGVDPL